MSSSWLGAGGSSSSSVSYTDPWRHTHSQALNPTSTPTLASLTLSNTASASSDAVRKDYVDARALVATTASQAVGTGDSPAFQAVTVAATTNASDAARKDYVDTKDSAMDTRMDAVETSAAASAATLSASVNQSVQTGASPSFAAATIAGTLSATTLSATTLNVTTVNNVASNNVNLSDLTLTLASGNAGDKSGADGAGIVLECGSDSDRKLVYDSTNDRFVVENAAGGLKVDALYLCDSLPAATSYGQFISGCDGQTPVCGRIFVGDGSGWSTRFAKRTGGSTTDLVTVGDSGRIGVGTSDPQAALHLQAASGNVGFVLRGGGSSTGFQCYQEGAGAAQLRHFQPNNSIVFATTDSGGTTVEAARFHAAVSGGAPAMSIGSTQRAATLTVGQSSSFTAFEVRNASNSALFSVGASGGSGVAVTNALSATSMSAQTFALAGNGSTGDLALTIANSSHASSNRAGIGFGTRWQLMCDSGANGTDDFALYDATRGEVLARWFDGVLNLDNGLYVNTSKEGSVGTFRVSGDTDDYLIYGDSATDRAAVGTASPAAKFHVRNTSGSQDIMHISESSGAHCWSFQNNGTLYARIGSAAGRFKVSFGGASGEYADTSLNGYFRVFPAANDLATAASALFEAPADTSEAVKVRNTGGLAVSAGNLAVSGNASISGTLTVGGSAIGGMLSSALDASIQWTATPVGSGVYRVVITGQASFSASETQTKTFPDSWQAASDMTDKTCCTLGYRGNSMAVLFKNKGTTSVQLENLDALDGTSVDYKIEFFGKQSSWAFS
jgi:hypothetical protein